MPDQKFQFLADKAARDQRVDKFLAARLSGISRSKIKAAIGVGDTRVNGMVAKPSLHLRPGDNVECWLRASQEENFPAPENIPIEILYEDDALAVVNKPAGLVVHAGAGVHSGTLVNALRYHLKSLSESPDPIRPGIVHRLDKLTSGLLVVAKTDAAHAALTEQFRTRAVEKRYVALVHGCPPRRSGEISLPVARDRIHRTRMTTRLAAGREALTRFHVVRTFEKYALLDVEIKTGRTHQIRVHLAAIGHPVVGDATYGAPHMIWIPGTTAPVATLDRHFLHSAHLSFVHPTTRSRMSFDSPLPDSLREFLEALDGRHRAAR